jgi:hypothetical protein
VILDHALRGFPKREAARGGSYNAVSPHILELALCVSLDRSYIT